MDVLKWVFDMGWPHVLSMVMGAGIVWLTLHRKVDRVEGSVTTAKTELDGLRAELAEARQEVMSTKRDVFVLKRDNEKMQDKLLVQNEELSIKTKLLEGQGIGPSDLEVDFNGGGADV